MKLLKGEKTVGCRRIYTIKYDKDGTPKWYKARLVAKGYTQTYNVNYLEACTPVAKINIMRVLLSMAVNYGWKLHLFDVKNAFLYRDLDEEIYMEISPGLISGA